jgi:toxin FitB
MAKKKPEQRVVAWISSIEESKLFLSVLTFGELLKGIEKLPDGGRRDTLRRWVNEDLQERFSGRIGMIAARKIEDMEAMINPWSA